MEGDEPPPVLESPPRLRGNTRLEDVDRPIKESCAAWERSLRPGQYFSEKGGHRPMRHRTQAVQGHHPGARAWPRGPDGGAWGPQSPIPSEKGYLPLVPSPTTSPGRRSGTRGQEGFFPGKGSPTDAAAFAMADAVAAEVGFEGIEREALQPFEPKALEDETLPPPPPTPPLEAPWKPPPPGFDARTLRRQASALRGEAAAAHRDEEAMRRSSLRLAEIFEGTVDNGKENASLAKERLRHLHAVLRRLTGERLRHGEAVKAAVAWQESLEELREKLASSEERQRRAERAKGDAQRALRAAVDANRAVEENVIPLERALEAAWRRDEVAAEMERQALQEEVADDFFRRRRRRPLSHVTVEDEMDGNGLVDCDEDGGGGGGDGGRSLSRFYGKHTSTSPLLLPTLSWGFRVFAEACRRSQGMRRLAAARKLRVEAERRGIVGEAFAAWTVVTALERRGREARRRRVVDVARLCLARWRIFAALEVRFRAERRRRPLVRVMEAWCSSVQEARRDRDLEQKREALALRRCFRGWRVLRARSTLTPQEYLELGRAADRHRLRHLFEAWHLAALASSASSEAVARGVRCRRDADTLASDFRAWASLSRARRWHRRHRLRQGLETLASFAAAGVGVGVGVVGGRLGVVGRAPGARSGGAPRFAGSVGLSLPPPSVDDWPPAAGGQRKQRQQFWGGDGGHGEKRAPRGGPAGSAGPAAAVRVCDSEALASSYCRRVALSRGIRALLVLRRRQWHAGSGAELKRRGQLFCCVHGDSRKEGIIVSARAVRAALWTWYGAANARRRARDGVKVAKRKRLVGAVRNWRRFALAAARQQRADRVGLLRRSFVALRQGCAVSRRQHSACGALQNALVSRRLGLLGSAMARLTAPGGSSAAARAAAAAPAAKRRREREALGAAWRWWVGGWLRRQAEGLRIRELEARRRVVRDRDLAEQLAQAQKGSTALRKEASAVEAELQRTEALVKEQEGALISSRRSLAEAAAAAAVVKARLGPAARFKTAGKMKGRKPAKGAAAAAVTAKRGDCGGGHGSRGRVRRRAGGGGGGSGSRDGVVGAVKNGVCDEELRRQRTKRPVRPRGASRVLAEAEARRKAAEKEVAARERGAAEARGELLGQEEADRAALEGALEATRRYAEDLERGRARVEEAGREKQRVRAETANLLERVEDLARKAQEEATQGARSASSAESERAALALGVSTAEARAREMMVILDEREREAAELRRALAGREAARQEKRLLLLDHTTPSPLSSPPMTATAAAAAAASHVKVEPMTTFLSLPPGGVRGEATTSLTGGGTGGVAGVDGSRGPMGGGGGVQELKESIALLQKKVEASRAGAE